MAPSKTTDGHHQIFSYAVKFPITKFLQAQSIVRPRAFISAGTILVVHLILTWVALYKFRLGLLGASLVLSLSGWIVVGVHILYIVKSEKCRHTWGGFSLEAFSGLPGFFKLSAASSVMLCLEACYFQIVVLLAGLLPNPELSLDSLSVCFSLNGWAFMISVGFNAAASVRVSNELGAGHPKSAAFSVLTGEAVANAVSGLCPLLALTLILNGIQPVLSGVADGCGWQAFVTYVNIGCYYVVGVPLGSLIGFYFKFGAKGLWSGMLGGTVMQTIILLWIIFRTDWRKCWNINYATSK